MRSTRPVTCLLVALTAFTAGISAVASTANAADEAPKAVEIGVDAKTIHIATSADVDNTLAPALFKQGVAGVTGAVKYINATGGIAGRKLVMDFYDSHLNPNDSRNNVITACQNDFAMVGNGMFLLTNFEDATNCTDKAGQATGLPNLPAVTTFSTESCSPITYLIAGNPIECSTIDSDPQTYRGLDGDSKYYLKKYGPKLQGPLVYSNDSKQTSHTTSGLGLLAEKAGIDVTQNFSLPSRSPQSAYTPLIQEMKTNGDNYNLTGQPVDNVISMRQEAQLQGLTDPDFVWACASQCYDQKVVAAGDAMANTHLYLNFLPFEEAKSNKELAAFLKYTGKANASAFAVWGWVSTMLFKQAVDQVVTDHGVNGVTRANLLDALGNTHEFDAGGFWGEVDVATKTGSPCFLILNFDGSKYKREYPSKSGTFDCKASNRTTVDLPLNAG